MSQLDLQETDHTERVTFFAEVLLPLPIPRRYTYRVPYSMNERVRRGGRVIVQFGKRKIYTGIIDQIHQNPPTAHQAKLILEILDEEPVINDLQFDLLNWMAGYYMSYPGEVLNAFIPSGLKLSSESKVQKHPDWEEGDSELTTGEATLLESLENNNVLSYGDISDILGIKNIYSVLKSLIGKGAILLFEEVKDKYVPKTEKRISLAKAYRSEEALRELFDKLSSQPKQEAVLLHYLQQADHGEYPPVPKKSFRRSDLSPSSLKTLVNNDIFVEELFQVPRFHWGGEMTEVQLSEYQEQRRNEILEHFEKSKPVLLHGVTGSGKTEIYIDLIAKALENGQQVLYLLPEIALTAQIVNRLKKSFGDNLGVYHSRFSDNERVEVWNAVTNEDVRLIVGVRSSLFLPFDNLGLIIIDEEHESSYKQFSPSPRYHGRDVAIMLAHLHKARVLLGSATPSLESMYNAKTGKYGLVKLDKRYGKANLPEFEIVDIQSERKRRKVKGEFSNVLIDRITEALSRKEQAIIFQNRRGYAPHLECEDCAWVPKCVQCSVSLTYHQYRKELKCHICGYREPVATSCPSCGSVRIKTVGFGTEKLEEELSLLFPEAVVRRMDLDTTRSKMSYENLIRDFENSKIDILVGTQMLSKGLDFDHVSLVGVVDLDRMLHFPDFRSHERTFHLTVQVSGRAGRRDKPGHVVVQTRNPNQPIIQLIKQNDYEGFYSSEAVERDIHRYPPFTRLIRITVKNKDQEGVRETSKLLADSLRKHLGKERVLGPEEPMIFKIRNMYLMDVLVKLEKNISNFKQIKAQIREVSDHLIAYKDHRGSRIQFDVDPN